jgi:hypothetical protein
LNQQDYFEAHGLSVLLYHNAYHGVFGDEKMSGLEIILLTLAREFFATDWDQTTVDEKSRYVQIHKPDGIPDVIQQIEHGVLALLAQYKVIGHAIPGIVEPTLVQDRPCWRASVLQGQIGRGTV